MLRTPLYEPLVPECDHGVRVFLPRASGEDREEMLCGVNYDKFGKTIRLQFTRTSLDLDLRKVEEKELRTMVRVLRKMNFDGLLDLRGTGF